jgi:hypothetical protein
MTSGNESQHDVSPKALEGGFERRGMRLIGVDSKTQIHRYEADRWRLLQRRHVITLINIFEHRNVDA